MSAEQGYAEAQFNLGNNYSKGEGVTKDPQQAINWYLKAAKQGIAGAQYNLAYFYYTGNGVPLDEIEGYAYYNLAGLTLEVARAKLGVLEKRLSKDTITAGLKRTKELQKEIEASKAGK
jgi:TPR repeat protein